MLLASISNNVLFRVEENKKKKIVKRHVQEIFQHLFYPMNFFQFPAGLKCLYKLSTSKIFEKNTNSAVENSETNGKDVQSEGSSSAGCESSTVSMADLDCHAVNKIELCVRSRILLVAGTGHVIVYQFSMSEETLELVVSFN